MMRFRLFICFTMLFTACVFDLGSTPENEGAIEGCQTSESCPSDARCTLGACMTVPTDLERLYTVRIIPKSDSGFQLFDIVDVQMDANGFLDLDTIRLPSTTKASGSIRTLDGESISAHILARSGDAQANRVQIESSTEKLGNVSTFQITLPTTSQTMAGTTRPLFFEFTIIPTDKTLFPPYVLNSVQATTVTTPFFIDLPDRQSLTTVKGRVVFDGAASLPVSGIKVMVVDDRQRRISTLVATAPDGTFEAKVWPENLSSARSIVLQSAQENLPKVTIPLSLTSESNEYDLETLTLGVDDFFFDLNGVLLGTEGIAAASVMAKGVRSIGQVTAAISATSKSGGFKLPILPGRYVVQATPPIGSPYGILRTEMELERNDTLTLRPPLKVRFQGGISDSDGRALDDVSVMAFLKEPVFGNPDLDDFPMPFGERVSHSRSDYNGRFELTLDPGQYDFVFTPSKSSGFPSFSRSLNLPRSEGTPAVYTFRAPTAHVLTFRLVDGTGNPLVGEEVEVWDQALDIRLASSRSNESGYVLLRIPQHYETGR